MNSYIVSIQIAYNSNALVEVEASNPDEAFAKGLDLLKKGKLGRHLPRNPRAYAKIVPKSSKDLPRASR